MGIRKLFYFSELGPSLPDEGLDGVRPAFSGSSTTINCEEKRRILVNTFSSERRN